MCATISYHHGVVCLAMLPVFALTLGRLGHRIGARTREAASYSWSLTPHSRRFRVLLQVPFRVD